MEWLNKKGSYNEKERKTEFKSIDD